MWRRKNGRIFVRENGRQYLYFFVKIDTVRWLYVERIDFTKLLYAKKIRKKNTPREFLSIIVEENTADGCRPAGIPSCQFRIIPAFPKDTSFFEIFS